MNKDQRKKLQPGLYRVYWKSGGYSFAAIGVTTNGDRWLAPTNWVLPAVGKIAWVAVEYVEKITAC